MTNLTAPFIYLAEYGSNYKQKGLSEFDREPRQVNKLLLRWIHI